MIVKATLVKHKTDDGLVEFNAGVPLGQEYLVDLQTRRKAQMLNGEFMVMHEKEVINDATNGRWLPIECLKLQVN